MQASDPELTVIIPAFKEAHKLERDVAAANEFLERSGVPGEIIVVDDGSPDDTAESARALQARFPVLRVVAYAKNRGKGHAIAQGVTQARGRYIMFADAGLCVPYEIASLGLTMLQLNMCDVANGSRRMRGSVRRAQPLYRRIGSRAYALVLHAFMGIPRYITDTQCGFKIYRSDVAKQLFGALVTDGFMFDVEIILRALRRRLRVLEFPVLWSNDADTRYDPVKGTLRNLKELTKIRVALLFEPAEDDELRTKRQALREEAHVS